MLFGNYPYISQHQNTRQKFCYVSGTNYFNGLLDQVIDLLYISVLCYCCDSDLSPTPYLVLTAQTGFQHRTSYVQLGWSNLLPLR